MTHYLGLDGGGLGGGLGGGAAGDIRSCTVPGTSSIGEKGLRARRCRIRNRDVDLNVVPFHRYVLIRLFVITITAAFIMACFMLLEEKTRRTTTCFQTRCVLHWLARHNPSAIDHDPNVHMSKEDGRGHNRY